MSPWPVEFKGNNRVLTGGVQNRKPGFGGMAGMCLPEANVDAAALGYACEALAR